jgi:arylsulfatase A-like enzyme
VGIDIFGRVVAVGCAGLLALSGCASSPPAPNGQSASAARAADRSRPNVVVIMADDLGYADITAYGINRIPTPNIDRIGNEGVKFTDGYATAPVCSPSRAGLQTGRYQQRFGFEFNNGPAARDAEEGLGLDTNEVTLGAALKREGYRTGLVGKWHLGAQDQFYPTNRGYDEFVGILSGATSYIDPTRPDVRMFVRDGKGGGEGPARTGRRTKYTQVVEGPDQKVVNNMDEYLTDYFGRRGAEFVRRNAASDDPYFLYLAFTAPHDPLMVTQKYYDRFSHIKTEHHRIYAAMVSALDDAVGEVLDAIDRSGEADNTIVYFLSDNGCAAYYDGMCACEPLRGGKLTHYEGGVRIPYMMRWPAQVEGGQVYRQVVSTLDIFPTVLSAAGGDLPRDRVYDGVDLLPYLSGQKTGAPHQSLMWRRSPLVSIRQGDWKLWKELNGKYTLLYNLKDDLNETTNLASKHPEKVRELEAALEQWSKDLQDPRWPSRPHTTYDVCGTPFTVPI